MFFDSHAMKNTVKATVDSLRLPTFKGFRLSLPLLPEQRAIATVLSDMDSEIAALELRLDKTRAIKQGMMQQLLTGSIRLPIPDADPTKTTPMTPEPPNVERGSSSRDEHLDCICGLANGRGGVLEIGRDNHGEAVGVTDVLCHGYTVRYRLDKLRTAGKVARVGPDKGGNWKVLAGSPAKLDPVADPNPRSPR